MPVILQLAALAAKRRKRTVASGRETHQNLGRMACLHRATGGTVGFMPSGRRAEAAATAFLKPAIDCNGQ